MMPTIKIIIASPHKRHNLLENELLKNTGIELLRIQNKNELNFLNINKFRPDFIFFPHWSWKIPKEIHENFECVIFHMTDLPFGRGGSPLQNLIVRGITETQLTALRCVEDLDAGSIYLKQPLSLLGTAEEILLRASKLVESMIITIISDKIVPFPQSGEPTIFNRRKAEEGDISEINELEKVFDYIRMLDADNYPPAFIETKHLKFEFSLASRKPDSILADVKITKK